jgi:hypothetical protein
MFHFTAFRIPFFRNSAGDFRHFALPPLLSIPFLAGLSFGSVIGLFADIPQELIASFGLMAHAENGASFLRAVWISSRFPLFAALLSTSVLGVILIPFLSALRGFSFACSVAAVIRPCSASSLFLTLLSIGLPAIVSLPAFLLAETDAIFVSRGFLSRDRSAAIREIPFIRHILFILLLCIADAVYVKFLFPLLRTLI